MGSKKSKWVFALVGAVAGYLVCNYTQKAQ
jgi:hypothetical protein